MEQIMRYVPYSAPYLIKHYKKKYTGSVTIDVILRYLEIAINTDPTYYLSIDYCWRTEVLSKIYMDYCLKTKSFQKVYKIPLAFRATGTFMNEAVYESPNTVFHASDPFWKTDEGKRLKKKLPRSDGVLRRSVSFITRK
jgi:hypothetical protein